MLHAVHPMTCDGTTSPEMSCSPAMCVALTTCPRCHSSCHRLHDRSDTRQSSQLRGVGFGASRHAHVNDGREEPLVEPLVENLSAEGRVGAAYAHSGGTSRVASRHTVLRRLQQRARYGGHF